MLNALGLGYSEVKIKPYLKMGVQRIQIANNKKTTSVKHQKKEVANLLADKKDEKARIKVEHIIRDDFLIEAYELIELLCELLHERIRQITSSKDTPPDDLKETVYSLVWAASNCDITELADVKKHLVRKYGSEYFKIVDENPAQVVNSRLFNKLSYRPPGRVLVNRYLEEIAKAYGVEWEAPLECELLDADAPYSTPTGFSIAMAPGSGISSAYGAPPPAPTQADPVAVKVASAPAPPATAGRKLTPAEQEEYDQFYKHQQKGPVQMAPVPEPVYPAVPGPPPHVKAEGNNQQGKGSGSGGGGDDQSGGDYTAAAAAGAESPAPMTPPPLPPFAGTPPPPPAPAPAAAAAETAPVDPMEAMLARLAALK